MRRRPNSDAPPSKLPVSAGRRCKIDITVSTSFCVDMSERSPRIYVLAGVDGAGKSSIGGAAFRELGGDYYNPDEAARTLMAADPAPSQTEANSAAWNAGVSLLKRAIDQRLDFAFETTLGANTIPRLVAHAASQGVEVH